MIKKISTLLVLFLSVLSLQAQEAEAFQIYNSKGKKVSYKKMLKSVQTSDILLFGEQHNNAIAHWLQYELTYELSTQRPLVLGAEMFEADNQDPLDQYLRGDIDDKGLDTLARLWKNYNTDYAPLVEIAKANQFPFIATNIPRRFASTVYKGGFESLDTLSDLEKSWIAPLPIIYDGEVECYKNILAMSHGHGGDNLPKAQAIKDATMAYFILKNYQPNAQFIHYNGSYHSDNHEGIMWYLLQSKPELNYLTITTVSQANVDELLEENKGLADFIIVVDENMTPTY